MKIYLLLFLSAIAVSARSQGLFEEKYDDCLSGKVCQYCGDTLPQPPDYFWEKIRQKIQTAPFGYNLRPGKLLYEILVDSTGHPCVVSIDDELFCYNMKNDILTAINEMAGWKAALLNGHPINATLVVQFTFKKGTYGFRFLERKEVTIIKR